MLVTYWSVEFILLFEYAYFFYGFSAIKIRRRIRLAKLFLADFQQTKIQQRIRLSVVAWGSICSRNIY